MLKQQEDVFQIPYRSGFYERRSTKLVLAVDLGSHIQSSFRTLVFPASARSDERIVAGFVTRIDRSAFIQQN